MSYNRETNPIYPPTYHVIDLAKDKNSYKILESFDKFEDALEATKKHKGNIKVASIAYDRGTKNV